MVKKRSFHESPRSQVKLAKDKVEASNFILLGMSRDMVISMKMFILFKSPARRHRGPGATPER
jgi:hypothetical protein